MCDCVYVSVFECGCTSVCVYTYVCLYMCVPSSIHISIQKCTLGIFVELRNFKIYWIELLVCEFQQNVQFLLAGMTE